MDKADTSVQREREKTRVIKSAKEAFVLYSPRRVVVSLLTRPGESLSFYDPTLPVKINIYIKKIHLGREQSNAIQ